MQNGFKGKNMKLNRSVYSLLVACLLSSSFACLAMKEDEKQPNLPYLSLLDGRSLIKQRCTDGNADKDTQKVCQELNEVLECAEYLHDQDLEVFNKPINEKLATLRAAYRESHFGDEPKDMQDIPTKEDPRLDKACRGQSDYNRTNGSRVNSEMYNTYRDDWLTKKLDSLLGLNILNVPSRIKTTLPKDSNEKQYQLELAHFKMIHEQLRAGGKKRL